MLNEKIVGNGDTESIDVSNIDFTNPDNIDKYTYLYMSGRYTRLKSKVIFGDLPTFQYMITNDKYNSIATQSKIPIYSKYKHVSKISDILVFLKNKPVNDWFLHPELADRTLNDRNIKRTNKGDGYYESVGKTVVMHHSAYIPRANATGIKQFNASYVIGNRASTPYTPYFAIIDPGTGDLYLNNIQAVDRFLGFQCSEMNTSTRGICIDGSFSYDYRYGKTEVGLETLNQNKHLTSDTNFTAFMGERIPEFYKNGVVVKDNPIFITYLAMIMNLQSPLLATHFTYNNTVCPGILLHVFLTWLSFHGILKEVNDILTAAIKTSNKETKELYENYKLVIEKLKIPVNTKNTLCIQYIYSVSADLKNPEDYDDISKFKNLLKTNNIFNDDIRDRMVASDKVFPKSDTLYQDQNIYGRDMTNNQLFKDM